MSTRTTLIIVSILIVASTLAGLLLWNQLPEPMASHWGTDDQVNGYMSKFWGVFLMPVITLAMLLMFLVIPAIDPLKANIATFRDYFNSFIALIVAFMVYIYGLTLVWNLGYTNFRMSSAMLPAMGLLFIFVGVMVGKAKRNYFIGIRTPWTGMRPTVSVASCLSPRACSPCWALSFQTMLSGSSCSRSSALRCSRLSTHTSCSSASQKRKAG
jgi:uncharacterized membrane protein